MALLYAGSIVCWAAAARYFGPWVAIAVAAFAPPLPGLRTDVPRALERDRRSPRRSLSGRSRRRGGVRTLGKPLRARRASAIALLALVRPGNAVLLAFVVVPAPRSAGTWRDRLAGRPRSSLAAVLPLLAWSMHNGVRFDSWALARGGNAIVPFYRAFITDHIVSPENGEESRRLAAAMQQHLLTREPYRSYGVTLDQLFRDGSFRVHEDLYLLSDEVFGWDSDYRVLRDAGVEGVRAHPGTYAPRRRSARSGTSSRRRSSAPSRRDEDCSSSRASDRRHRGKRLARAERGRADSHGPGRLDLAAGQQHPAGLDVADGVALRVRAPGTAPASFASSARSDDLFAALPDRPATHASHSVSTSSRAGSRGRGCGSFSGSRRSRGGGREGGRPLSRSRSRLSS